MTDASEFRKRARECIAMASKMRPESRELLMTIAEAWLVLAHATETKSPAQQTHEVEAESDAVH
jgi:hypothetical protein